MNTYLPAGKGKVKVLSPADPELYSSGFKTSLRKYWKTLRLLEKGISGQEQPAIQKVQNLEVKLTHLFIREDNIFPKSLLNCQLKSLEISPSECRAAQTQNSLSLKHDLGIFLEVICK